MSSVNVSRLNRIHELIRRKATGTPSQFAERLGISKSMLMVHLSQLKDLGGPIKYDYVAQSYYYTASCSFFFGYADSDSSFDVHGGTDYGMLVDTFTNFGMLNGKVDF
jgi:biotin operon repressor